MREVKFRGKSLNTGMWVYGDLQHKGKRAFVEYEVDPATVGQHTGFTDKNAREVYEGDVLTDKFESIGVVEWQNGCFVVNFGDVDVFQISCLLMKFEEENGVQISDLSIYPREICTEYGKMIDRQIGTSIIVKI